MEIVRFRRNEVEVSPADDGESLFSLVRQDVHRTATVDETLLLHEDTSVRATRERKLGPELLVCTVEDDVTQAMTVVIGEWDARSDELRRSVRFAADDMLTLFGLPLPLESETLLEQKPAIKEFYLKATEMNEPMIMPLEDLRRQPNFAAFLMGSTVEKL